MVGRSVGVGAGAGVGVTVGTGVAVGVAVPAPVSGPPGGTGVGVGVAVGTGVGVGVAVASFFEPLIANAPSRSNRRITIAAPINNFCRLFNYTPHTINLNPSPANPD
jgi:hypothetical protein